MRARLNFYVDARIQEGRPRDYVAGRSWISPKEIGLGVVGLVTVAPRSDWQIGHMNGKRGSHRRDCDKPPSRDRSMAWPM